MTEKLDGLLSSNENFNSLSVVDREGVVLATSPNLGYSRTKLETERPKEALYERKNLISTPLWDEANRYLGYLSGTIYLQENNILHDILGKHFATDGSYVWVVDNKGMLIYHPDAERIGKSVAGNEIALKTKRQESGTQKVTNSEGVDYLAGYTFIKSGKWGVVSQTPYAESVKPSIGMVYQVLFYALPFVIFFFWVTLMLTNRLSFPLRKLAMYSVELKEKGGKGQQTDIPTWYFEAKQLNETIREYARW